MGKHKDKDKDRERKKKKDKDKERSKKEKEVDKEKSRHKSDRKHSPEDPQEAEASRHRHGSPSRPHKDKREDHKRRRSPDSKEHRSSKRSHTELEEKQPIESEVSSGKGGGAELSLSIEETNKLRLQLGLKPLDVGGSSGKKSSAEGDQPAAAPTTSTDGQAVEGEGENEEETDGESKKKEPTHLPPKNIGEEAAAEKIREKLKVMRETREIAKKLSTVKGLGEEDESDKMDATDWVTRMREKEKEKEMAKKRAKLLAEMDDEFGVSDLMEEEFSEKFPSSKPQKKTDYTSSSLSGLKIEHKEDHFREGRDIILTLKDARVLDDEAEDVLVNVNMKDDESAARNVQLKKGKPGYVPYEEEFDEYGNPKTRSLLYKYDEEIEGIKKESFVLGQRGTFDVSKIEREKEESKRLLEQRAIKLELPKAVIASEYYTSEEMVQFKKRKRRKKKEKFKADDLLPLGNEEEEAPKDHGSRRRQISEPENESQPTETKVEEGEAMEVDVKPDPNLLDDHDSNVETALARTRRLLKGSNYSERKTGAAFVATMVAAKPQIKEEPVEEEEGEDGMLVLNTTAEFCRNIGEEEEVETMESSNGGGVTVKQEDGDNEDNDMDEEDEDDYDESKGQLSGWKEVDPSTDSDKGKKQSTDVDVFELDVVMSTGVASALQMANKKGFIDAEGAKGGKKDGSSKTIIEGIGVRDWEYERDRGRERDREREHGREMPFAEKSGYIPDVNIEYVDNMGRLLTPKEAFRHMSHKFHGKTSGKKKNEKRMKRLQEEFLLNQASTVDTPLQTVELFRKRQENSQTPYVVLTGTQQQHALNMTELTKRK